MIFNFLKYLFLIKGLTTYILFEFISIPQIKSSEIILNEENINLNSFISYARKSHTDNFILVDANGKAYKSCLAPLVEKWFGIKRENIVDIVAQLVD